MSRNSLANTDLQVIRAYVLVVEVIGMLPDVNPQEWNQALIIRGDNTSMTGHEMY